MSTHPSASDTIEEFLARRATSDLRDGFVAPKEDVTRRVAQDIERRSGCPYWPIMADYPAGKTENIPLVRMSADPSTFAQNTVREIVRISTTLSAAQAKKFDLRFDNPQTAESLRSEQIWIAARYVT